MTGTTSCSSTRNSNHFSLANSDTLYARLGHFLRLPTPSHVDLCYPIYCVYCIDTFSPYLPYANLCAPHVHVLQTPTPPPLRTTQRTRPDAYFYTSPKTWRVFHIEQLPFRVTLQSNAHSTRSSSIPLCRSVWESLESFVSRQLIVGKARPRPRPLNPPPHRYQKLASTKSVTRISGAEGCGSRRRPTPGGFRDFDAGYLQSPHRMLRTGTPLGGSRAAIYSTIGPLNPPVVDCSNKQRWCAFDNTANC